MKVGVAPKVYGAAIAAVLWPFAETIYCTKYKTSGQDMSLWGALGGKCDTFTHPNIELIYGPSLNIPEFLLTLFMGKG